ncbi:P-loop ATPase, Sll1717 family [Cellvibrio sp. PSBB023]|uniref:P-loop ATPase, Sll1717 family n=1 Tax=Cellvibrio sp. PSBB023 TaxID=1945512 RepID=UPI00098F9CD0|nr:DNA repair ATPase [Cellvibrio sp. PSBB023]AQT61838.1 DNA repair ATPase [Cellvibrio sp. PSBB023]
MPNLPKSDFVFRKHMNIGEADAENDKGFLSDCFVDNGDLEVLEDTAAAPAIVLGRTGAGKSALLDELEEKCERVIRIEPESLALKHISNSSVLKFFEEVGVNLDIFYNVLWQHTFAVELIKNKYQIDSQAAKSSFLSTITNIISGDRKKQEALDYLEKWETKFWITTEERIKEFTNKIEKDLSFSIASKMPGTEIKAGGALKLSDEQKTEIIHIGKNVVNGIQLEKLSRIIQLLSEDIFTDPQKKTYIVIDKLDENWVEDSLRYKLIKALIETIKKFKKIENVKIIFTLRVDLLNRVIEKTRDAGFQREKYESLFLKVEWKRDQLKKLLDLRINHLLKNKYTKDDVYFDDIFPTTIEKSPASDYILERTLLRPRDAIIFVNECLIEAQGKTQISGEIIKSAEKTYSSNRLESLTYEWSVEHPLLNKYMEVLYHKNYNFKVSTITTDEMESLIMKIQNESMSQEDILVNLANKYMHSEYPASEKILRDFKNNLFYILYKIGVVGIKVDGTSSAKWIHDRTQDLTAERIEPTSIIYIHKMLHRALAINSKSQ